MTVSVINPSNNILHTATRTPISDTAGMGTIVCNRKATGTKNKVYVGNEKSEKTCNSIKSCEENTKYLRKDNKMTFPKRLRS